MHFYIYEKDINYIKTCKEIINKVLFPLAIPYQVTEIKEMKDFTEDSNKVLILNPKLKLSELLINELRQKGDFKTPIICLLNENEMLYFIEHNCSLWFSTLCIKNSIFQEQLTIRLQNILRFYLKQPSFSVYQNGEMFQIPYQDILYIEKELYTNFCHIVTKNQSYSIRSSVRQIEEELGSLSNFFKCHQSCIINLENVTHIDFTSNKIYFGKGNLSLISRSKKQELKSKFQLYRS